MSSSKDPTAKAAPNRATARQQVFVGFGLVFLATLMVQTLAANFPLFNETPPSNAISNDAPMPSASIVSKAQLQTILSSISQLSDLIKERTASLDHKLNGITCAAGRPNQEFSGPIFAACMIGAFSAFMWVIGLAVTTDGLNKISEALRNRAWGCGLLGANAGLAFLAVMPPENWVSYISGTLWALYIGILGGILSDRETFLAE